MTQLTVTLIRWDSGYLSPPILKMPEGATSNDAEVVKSNWAILKSAAVALDNEEQATQ